MTASVATVMTLECRTQCSGVKCTQCHLRGMVAHGVTHWKLRHVLTRPTKRGYARGARGLTDWELWHG
jgi:hypothetical protein